MDRANRSLLTTFPDTLTHSSATYPCIAPPVEQLKKMQANNYDLNATADFQMLESDRAKAGITTRSVISSHNLTFEVYAIAGDPNDTMVRLRCFNKQ